MKLKWLLFLLLVFITGCGPAIRAGTIVAKSYTPGYMQMIYVSTGNSGYFVNVWIPDSWQIKIVQEDSTCGWRSISQQDYERFKVDTQVEYAH